MNTVEKINELINKSNRSASGIFKELQIPHNALTEWKKGKAKPSAEALSKIADYFDVSVDYLLGRTDVPNIVVPKLIESLPLAFNGGMDDLSQDDIDSINEYVEFIRNKKKDK